MTLFIRWILSAVFLSSNRVHAAPLSSPELLQKLGKEYGTSISHSRLRISQSGLIQKGTDVAVHQGQALLLIMILTGVDLVKQHIQQSQLSGQPISQAQLLEHASQAAEHILKSGEIWSSLAGASTASAVMSKPIAIIQQIIATKVSRDIFKNLLQSGIATFVLFIGWEMGGQLYKEASEMIEDPADYQKSKSLGSLLANSIRQAIDPQEPEYQENWRVLKLVFSNMLQILVHDHDLRNLWLYNTWRNRIATGDFVALVTAMVGASVLGTAIFPGAGTFAGMMFGIVGGLLVMFIPQDQKDQVTSGIQWLRFHFWKMGDDRGPLFDVRKDTLEIMFEVISTNRPWPPLLKYQPVANAGEKMMDVLIERIYRLESRLQSTTAMKTVALMAGNRLKASEFGAQQHQIITTYLSTLDDLEKIYRQSNEELDAALQEFPVLKDMNSKKMMTYPELKNVLADRDRLEKISNFMSFFSRTIKGNMLARNQLYLPALNRFFMFGFSEDRLLQVQESTP